MKCQTIKAKVPVLGFLSKQHFIILKPNKKIIHGTKVIIYFFKDFFQMVSKLDLKLLTNSMSIFFASWSFFRRKLIGRILPGSG